MAAILETFMRNRFKISEERLTHCRSCEEFETLTSRCKQCGCFMPIKVKIPGQECPLKKW